MKITVNRLQLKQDETISDVFIDSEFFCYGLEDAVREKIGTPTVDWKIWGKTAIPVGVYDVTINWSNRFKRQMIEILRVPGWSGVRIHNGKGPESTDGCLIVNMKPLFDYNREAMLSLEKKVLDSLTRKEKVIIEFINSPTSEYKSNG